MNIENFPKDVLVLIALELDYLQILKFCRSHKNVDEKVCKNKAFWRNKLKLDFPEVNYERELFNSNPQYLYSRINDLIKFYPEFKDILSLLTQLPLERYLEDEGPSKVKHLLKILDQKVLNKIKNDYNSHEIYARRKKIKEANAKDILKFMEDSGLVFKQEYELYYHNLMAELKEYVKNPNYIFDPSKWEGVLEL